MSSQAPTHADQFEVELSVVVAAQNSDRALDSCVDALEAACAGVRAEIVIAAHEESLARGLADRHTGALPCVVAGKGLVPELWLAGIEQARGRIVALTTGHMIVGPLWAHALIEAFAGPVAGAGGPIDLMPGTGVVDWAIYYLRYSAFLPWRWPDGLVIRDLAGDNAAYRREDLQRHGHTFDRGFWEVEFHRRLQAEGRTLRAVSAASARLGPSYRFGAFLRQRLEHGRHFGHARAHDGSRSRLTLVAAAPLVPAVLAWRAARRVGIDRSHGFQFLVALPVFLIFAAAWAAGEALGAVAGDGVAR